LQKLLIFLEAFLPFNVKKYYFYHTKSSLKGLENVRLRRNWHYTTFGSSMPGRNYQSGNSYRYGFNGKENDRETVSTGEGTQDYGFRIYNPALGRFLSVDPLSQEYPWYTPYQFAGNKPIWAIDLDGLEEYFVTETLGQNGYTRIYEKNPDLKARASDVGKFQFKDGASGKPVGAIIPLSPQNYGDIAAINKTGKNGENWEWGQIRASKPLIQKTNEKEIKEKQNKPTSEKKVEDKIKDKAPAETEDVEETQTIKYVVLDITINNNALKKFSDKKEFKKYLDGATKYWKAKGYDEVKFRKIIPTHSDMVTDTKDGTNSSTSIHKVEEGTKEVKVKK
jgi:RHS repeat-associated protein